MNQSEPPPAEQSQLFVMALEFSFQEIQEVITERTHYCCSFCSNTLLEHITQIGTGFRLSVSRNDGPANISKSIYVKESGFKGLRVLLHSTRAITAAVERGRAWLIPRLWARFDGVLMSARKSWAPVF